jgi:cell wall-associated NlpC family hydrolase
MKGLIMHRRHRRVEKLAPVLEFLEKQIGKRYKFGAMGPDEFDCSGLACKAYEEIGIELPHNSLMQYMDTVRVFRTGLHPVPGDLVFYYHPIDHIAIYVGRDDYTHKKIIIQATNRANGVQKLEIDRYAQPVAWGRVKLS